ncbi:MAG: NADH-quinone oxidoreductase subunit L, partial [Gammaproteobacteria bacterium]
PLLFLAIPSLAAGYFAYESVGLGQWFDGVLVQHADHIVMTADEVAEEGSDAIHFMLHAVSEPFPMVFVVLGVFFAWFLYIKRPELPTQIAEQFSWIHRILLDKYGFDRFNDFFFAGGTRKVGQSLWKTGDVTVIDGVVVNGTANSIGLFARIFRVIQTGYMYHYAFAMIMGLLVLLTWGIWV